MDRRKDGQKHRRMDRQTLFYRTLPAEARGPKRKAKKYLFDNLYVKCIKDNKTFREVIKSTSLVNHQEMKKLL